MITLIGIVVASAIGAPVRYLLDQYVQHRRESIFPWGTWTINVSGAFLLGLIVGLGLHHGLPKEVVTVAGTGFCGAYTTFSTFSYETIRLLEDGSVAAAMTNAAMSLAIGLLAAAAGLALALL